MHDQDADGGLPQWYEEFMALPGELSELEQITALSGDTWALVFSDEQLLTVEATDRPGVLALSVILGPVPQGREQQLYETALSVNLLWRDTDGLRLGLAGSGGDMVLSREVTVTGVAGLTDAILALRTFAAGWRTLAHSAAPDDPSALLEPSRIGHLV